jgi:hypothetical protein
MSETSSEQHEGAQAVGEESAEQGAVPKGALSEESLRDWAAFTESLSGDAAPLVQQEALNRFLIGVHTRGETLQAHELKSLLDGSGVAADLGQQVFAFAGPAIALLETYDVARREAQEAADEEDLIYVGDDEFDVEIGTLIL